MIKSLFFKGRYTFWHLYHQLMLTWQPGSQVDEDLWDQGRAEVGRVGQERHRGPRLRHWREEASVPGFYREME